jgi:hypothetical protein
MIQAFQLGSCALVNAAPGHPSVGQSPCIVRAGLSTKPRLGYGTGSLFESSSADERLLSASPPLPAHPLGPHWKPSPQPRSLVEPGQARGTGGPTRPPQPNTRPRTHPPPPPPPPPPRPPRPPPQRTIPRRLRPPAPCLPPSPPLLPVQIPSHRCHSCGRQRCRGSGNSAGRGGRRAGRGTPRTPHEPPPRSRPPPENPHAAAAAAVAAYSASAGGIPADTAARRAAAGSKAVTG